MPTEAQEGVIHFHAAHHRGPLRGPKIPEIAASIAAWRRISRALGVVGCEPGRYGGAGFGNVSCRVGPRARARGRRSFVITGTQTGELDTLDHNHLCEVTRYDVTRNLVESTGPILPSSESLTHGAIYDMSPAVQFVIHGHGPALWQRARALRIPVTDPDVPYGTPEMAREVERLARTEPVWERRVFAMGGHEDGVIAFGRTADEAGRALVSALAAAWAHG